MANLSERTAFLREAARYFEARPTGGEDAAHWSNVYNAKNCRDIATILDSLTVEGLAGVIFETLPDRSAWDGAERREINAEDDRTAKDIASKLLTYITGKFHD